jgi:hypothetical protein
MLTVQDLKAQLFEAQAELEYLRENGCHEELIWDAEGEVTNLTAALEESDPYFQERMAELGRFNDDEIDGIFGAYE